MENGGNLPSTLNSTTTGSTKTTSGSTTTVSGGGNSPTRKKRNVGSGGSVSSENEEESKTGCPKDFERMSDYLCLHFHKDTTGAGIFSTFEDAKKHCMEKDSSAGVLQFVNDKEASKIWKWLGNFVF